MTGVPPEIATFASRNGLELGARLDGFASHVFAAGNESGAQVVLKLGRASEVSKSDIALEAAGLRAWNGYGAVRLLSEDAELGLLVLERVLPGTHLTSDGFGVSVAASLLWVLHSVRPPTGHGFPDLAAIIPAWATRHRRPDATGTAGFGLLDMAERTAGALNTTGEKTVLLHGDFLTKNIIRGQLEYVAIDPRPRIGDPCSDAGMFASFCQPAGSILGIAERIAGLTGYDRLRCCQWAAVWSVGEACETWREDSDELQRWIAGAEVSTLLTSV